MRFEINKSSGWMVLPSVLCFLNLERTLADAKRRDLVGRQI